MEWTYEMRREMQEVFARRRAPQPFFRALSLRAAVTWSRASLQERRKPPFTDCALACV